MIYLKINDIKKTMLELFGSESFDALYLLETEALTAALLHIDGKRNPDWYDSDEIDYNLTEWMTWKEIKGMVFEYIKGSKTPKLLKISLKADDMTALNLIEKSGCMDAYSTMKPGLHIQFRYENGQLGLVTAVSFNEFTMDRTLERAWDEAVQEWMRNLQIGYEIL